MKQQDQMTGITLQHSPIESLHFPSDWFEDVPEFGPLPNAYSRNFRSLTFPTGQIFLMHRGLPIDATACGDLMHLLSEHPQILTKSKIEQIRPALGNIAEEAVFRPLIVKTETIGGANVVLVEGRWSNDDDVYAIFFPESPGSDIILELHYQAPKEDFRKNLAIVKTAFASIKWEV